MADPENDTAPRGPWTTEETLAFDLAYALPRSHVRGIRRAFTEDERRSIAKGMVEHLKLCGSSCRRRKWGMVAGGADQRRGFVYR